MASSQANALHDVPRAFAAKQSLHLISGAVREHLGMKEVELRRDANGAVLDRGPAPAFSMEHGKAVVRDWNSGELIQGFNGIAYDYLAQNFILLGEYEGQRSFNPLMNTTYALAQAEAEVQVQRLKIAI